MGAEVAKLSLWLASFVPGLSLAYLGRNIVVGNSLLGVMRPESLTGPDKANQTSWLDVALADALDQAPWLPGGLRQVTIGARRVRG